MAEDKGHSEGGWNWPWFGRSWQTAAQFPLIVAPPCIFHRLPYPTSPCFRIWSSVGEQRWTLNIAGKSFSSFSLLGHGFIRTDLHRLTLSSFVSAALDLDISIRLISRGGWNWRSRWPFAAGPSSVWPSSLSTWCWTASSTIPPGDRAPGTFLG